MITILAGDMSEHLASIADNSIDACITDPPYGLGAVTEIRKLLISWLLDKDGYEYQSKGFMAREWDKLPHPAMWKQLYRVLKPGAHVACFAGSRTADLMGIGLRLAGFEIRDTIMWVQMQGFPKSHNISKAMDEDRGLERPKVGAGKRSHDIRNGQGRAYGSGLFAGEETPHITTYDSLPVSDEAQQWDGWGTGLKPANEPIIIARKPLDGRIIDNVRVWGVGGININGTRVPTGDPLGRSSAGYQKGDYVGGDPAGWNGIGTTVEGGRWPPNVIMSHGPECTETVCMADCPVGLLNEQGGWTESRIRPHTVTNRSTYSPMASDDQEKIIGKDDAGYLSRMIPTFPYEPFFYHSKASRAERFGHITTKPVAVIAWLCKLLCPPNSTVIDPFAGSGTLMAAAEPMGISSVLIEADPEHVEIIQERMRAMKQPTRKTKGKKAAKVDVNLAIPTVAQLEQSVLF